LHGFEVKASRSDWLREKDNPAEADKIFCFCDRWWLVVGESSIVQDGELPGPWGLMVLNGKGLKVVTQAPELQPEPMPRKFLAAMLRAAMEYVVPKADWTDAAYQQGQEAGRNSAEMCHERELSMWRRRAEDAEKATREFEERTGLGLTQFNVGRIAEAVRILMSPTDLQKQIELLEQSERRAKADSRHYRKQVEILRASAGLQLVTYGEDDG
jgi:hypothetical protein